MRKVTVFLALLIASLASLIVLITVGFYIFTAGSQYPPSWMSGMWGHMMGGGMQVSGQNPALPYFGVLFVVLVGITIVGVGGLAYFLAFPEIKTAQPVAKTGAVQLAQNPDTAYASVLKTLTDEERKVVEVLTAHGGKYLQKYIRKEAGLSRLKTHRVLARLAERGIVTLEKTGNTNQVFLANWLKRQE